MEPINVVWLKRDLRLKDHAPLAAACLRAEPMLLLYILEPSLVDSHHYTDRHWQFVWQSLQDMRSALRSYGLNIWSVYEEVDAVFKLLSKHAHIKSVFSHEETGVDITFQRDIAMADYFKAEGIRWQQYPTNAVQRGLMNRNGWRADWKRIINQPLENPDLNMSEQVTMLESCREWLQSRRIPQHFKKPNMLFQVGGTTNAWNTVDDFLYGRSRHYNDAISAPDPAQVGCSRLSPYITWGNVSIRQLWQYVDGIYGRLAWKRPVRSFRSRLQWHCHFVQKFESEPRMEFQNLNRGYDDIRCKIDPSKVDAWKQGQTGIPMVDACMRSVKATGYLNFRMRAMLVSFLTHHLWQPWQAGAAFLGRQFLDFEPGIHYSQFQMQAGTMGVNRIRIYNPVKQGYDHDPEGYFIRQWVPELRTIPLQFIHEPWKLSAMERQMYGYEPGTTYPAPMILDVKASYNKASEILWAKKEEASVIKENKRIVEKHVKNRR